MQLHVQKLLIHLNKILFVFKTWFRINNLNIWFHILIFYKQRPNIVFSAIFKALPRYLFAYQHWHNFIWARLWLVGCWFAGCWLVWTTLLPFFQLSWIFTHQHTQAQDAGCWFPGCMHNNMAVAPTGSPTCVALNLCQTAVSQLHLRFLGRERYNGLNEPHEGDENELGGHSVEAQFNIRSPESRLSPKLSAFHLRF